MTTESGHDLLKEIPSPSRRLWVGLCVILSIFLIFAAYTLLEVRWLEDFQANVVQKNRKASLQLLRFQNDAYLLAISLRDLAAAQGRYPIRDWRSGFNRLRQDMEDALDLEGRYSVSTTAADDKKVQLRIALANFWRSSDLAFSLSREGKEAAARKMVETELPSKVAEISETVARLLVLNDQAEADASEKINRVYGDVKRNFLLVIVVLFMLALGTGLYTLQASRKTFEKLHVLAEKLGEQSEQLRKLSWKLIDVQEETLRRVARDLHDEFGQILTAIGVMLSRAGRQAPGTNPILVEEIQRVKKIVEETLHNVRDRSQMFRPAVLDDFGLEQSLEWFVQQFSRQAGIKVHFSSKLRDGFFPPEDAIHVYRIVQEGLNNVARHSTAQEAWVSLDQHESKLSLEIRDNGVGFDQGTEAGRSGGVGLMGMRERAQHLGGTLIIQSARGKGTVIQVQVPMRRAASTPLVS